MVAGATPPTLHRSSHYARYVVGVLLIVYILNQTDRALFAFLMQPIKSEFRLTDTQLGFLAGPALSVLYCILGIPVARWGDRSQRVNIMAGAVALWSAVILAFAAVKSFWQLAMTQVGVGIGEAGFTAIAISVIADYYRENAARVHALSVFNLAIPIAGIVSGLFAGWLNQTHGWRSVFIAAGVPGLMLALLMKGTIQEPARQERSLGAAAPMLPTPLRGILEMLWSTRSLRHLAAGAFLANVVTCLLNWLPTFLVRTRGMDSGEVGIWNAAISGIGGGAGIWLSGRLTGRRSSGIGETTQIIAVATAAVFPTLVLSLWCSSKYLSLLALMSCQALMYFFLTPTLATVQALSAQGIHATIVSLYILLIVGGGILSVQVVGALSDAVTPLLGNDSRALQWSMTVMSTLAIWAAVHFWLAGRSPQKA